MSFTVKLLIPVALGIVAAAANWILLTQNTAKVYFATVREALAPGDTIQLENLEPLELSQQFAGLSRSIVPFADRGVLSGRVVRRAIENGDPIFFADTDLGGQWLDLQDGEELFPVSLDGVSADPNLLRIGNMIHFRVPPLDQVEQGPVWIGPFRIVAVGAKISNNLSDDGRSVSSGSLNIGIAYNPSRDTHITRLEKFCDEQRRGRAMLLGIRIRD